MALGIRSRLDFTDVSDCVQTLFTPANSTSSFSTIGEETELDLNLSTSFDTTQEWNSELLTPSSSESSPSWSSSWCSPTSTRMSSRQTPPGSPPSLRALRLFDTPHTPKTLLQRSKNAESVPPESPDCRNSRGKRLTASKSRRVLGEKKPFSEPRGNSYRPSIEANINPFTPNHDESTIQTHKRSRLNLERYVNICLNGILCKYIKYPINFPANSS